MTSGDLIPSDRDQSEPDSVEVQFALVIARMIDSIKNNPEDMRQAVYDLARYKLREQFTHADPEDVKRTMQALETAIRGVEAFSKQRPTIAVSIPTPLLGNRDIARAFGKPISRLEAVPSVRAPPNFELAIETNASVPKASSSIIWSRLGRAAAMIAIVVGVLIAIQQRERPVRLAHMMPKPEWQIPLEENQPPAQPVKDLAPQPPVRPAPLRPTDYGVYAISNDALFELQQLPGRPPEIRVAVSAALKTPSRTLLPNGHPRFIVFRRDVASNISDRAEVRIIAKIAREFSSEVIGKKPADGDDIWVIRNISFPFRSSPVNENPEMYELHSEDPTLALTPGRYALVLKSQAYDFSVEGEPVDPKQCIERIVASNGTFYSDCKNP